MARRQIRDLARSIVEQIRGSTTMTEEEWDRSDSPYPMMKACGWEVGSPGPTSYWGPSLTPNGNAMFVERSVIDLWAICVRQASKAGKLQRYLVDQADLLREVIGNPFAATIRPQNEWFTSSGRVFMMAQVAVITKDYEMLPVLADALEDAGCTEERLLKHLRGPTSVHVDGCWALRLLTGR